MAAPGARTRRRYDSPRRKRQAEQTRALVLDAATARFGERGWAGTGMREVAREAGVSVETIYATFGSKSDLLMAALDAAVVGDLAAIPLAERDEFGTLGEGELADRAAAAAHLARQINERTSGIRAALREGARTEPELAARQAAGERRRIVDVERAARLVAGRGVTETERDGLWALVGVDVYQLLTEHAGWSSERYEAWIADTIIRMLAPTEGDQDDDGRNPGGHPDDGHRARRVPA
jgi:AcrR family transcriptional regulator